MRNSVSGSREPKWSRIQLMVVAIAIAIRGMVLLLLWNQPLMGDPASYHKVALDIVAGTRFYPYWPPGLPLYLAAIHSLLGPTEAIARVAVFVLFIFFIFLLRRLLVEIAGERLATVGLLLIAIYPVFIDYAIDPLTHLPVAFCLLGVILCTKRLLAKQTILYAILLGVSLSVMVLIRASSSLILCAVPIFCYWKLRSLKSSLVIIAAAGVVIGAWLIRANDLAGEFLWINGSNDQNFYFGNSAFTPDYRTWWIGSHGGEGLVDSASLSHVRDSVDALGHHDANNYYRKTAIAFIEDHPGRFLLRTANRIATFLVFDSFTSAYAKNVGVPKWGVVFVLLLDGVCYLTLLTLTVAFVVFYWRSVLSDSLLQLMLLISLLYAIPYWISFSSSVYHTPLLPIFLLFGLLFLKSSPVSVWKEQWQEQFTKKQKVIFGCSLVYIAFVQVQFALNMASRL